MSLCPFRLLRWATIFLLKLIWGQLTATSWGTSCRSQRITSNKTFFKTWNVILFFLFLIFYKFNKTIKRNSFGAFSLAPCHSGTSERRFCMKRFRLLEFVLRFWNQTHIKADIISWAHEGALEQQETNTNNLSLKTSTFQTKRKKIFFRLHLLWWVHFSCFSAKYFSGCVWICARSVRQEVTCSQSRGVRAVFVFLGFFLERQSDC